MYTRARTEAKLCARERCSKPCSAESLGMSGVPHLGGGKTKDSLPYKGRMWAPKEVPDLR